MKGTKVIVHKTVSQKSQVIDSYIDVKAAAWVSNPLWDLDHILVEPRQTLPVFLGNARRIYKADDGCWSCLFQPVSADTGMCCWKSFCICYAFASFDDFRKDPARLESSFTPAAIILRGKWVVLSKMILKTLEMGIEYLLCFCLIVPSGSKCVYIIRL